MLKKLWVYETYTCNPVTGDGGWDIKYVAVVAENKEQARELVKTFPHFDCIILTAVTGSELSERDMKAYAAGNSVWECDGMNYEPINY